MDREANDSRIYQHNWGDLDAAVAELPWTDDSASTRIDVVRPPPDQLRSRKVTSRSNLKRTSKYPSLKAGRMVRCESRPECWMHVLLDGCPSVRWVAEQPFRLDFDWDGQRARHFPDVEVEYAGRRLVLEIKKRDEAESDEVAARTRLLSPALARLGYSYRVITEEIYARQPRLRNVGWLLRRGREEVSVSQASALIQRIADKECAAWGELGELQFPAARLVLEGVLIVDLHNQISPDTQLMTAQGGDHVHWIH